MFEKFTNQLKNKFNYFISSRAIKRVDNKPIHAKKDEIRCFLMVRNERLRLPYLLNYYRKLGVNRFFVLDNDSTDDSIDFLLKQADVHVLSTKESYIKRDNWLKYLLANFGMNYWCVVTDADELLVYPHSEDIDLSKLTNYLEHNDFNCLKCLWVDMYSDKPLVETSYNYHYSFFDTCRFFDKECKQFGPTKRIFGWRPELDKVQLIKCDNTITYESFGHHRVYGDVKAADISGCVFHFPYFSDFIQKAQIESQRGVHYKGAAKYKQFNEVLIQKPQLSFFQADISEEYQNTEQLIELGILNSSQQYKNYLYPKGISNH